VVAEKGAGAKGLLRRGQVTLPANKGLVAAAAVAVLAVVVVVVPL